MFRPSLGGVCFYSQVSNQPKDSRGYCIFPQPGSPTHTLPKHGLPWPPNIDTFATALPSSSPGSPPPLPGQTAPPLLRKRDRGRAEERQGGSGDPLQRGPLPFPGIGGAYPIPLAGEARVNVQVWLKGPIVPPRAGHRCAHFPQNWKCRGRLMDSGC